MPHARHRHEFRRRRDHGGQQLVAVFPPHEIHDLVGRAVHLGEARGENEGSARALWVAIATASVTVGRSVGRSVGRYLQQRKRLGRGRQRGGVIRPQRQPRGEGHTPSQRQGRPQTDVQRQRPPLRKPADQDLAGGNAFVHLGLVDVRTGCMYVYM